MASQKHKRHGPPKECPRCGKRSYRTEAAAMRVVQDGGGIRAYPCPHEYGRWHVTSKHIGDWQENLRR